MDLLRYGGAQQPPVPVYQGRYRPAEATAATAMTAPTAADDALAPLHTIGGEWAGEVMQCFRQSQAEVDPFWSSHRRMADMVRVMYLLPLLHNLAVDAIRRIAYAATTPAGQALRQPSPGHALMLTREVSERIDAYMARGGTNFFVLRGLLARKLRPVAGQLRDTLHALGRSEDAERCAACVVATVDLLERPGCSRTVADEALAAMARLGRELEDCLRLVALDLDDAQPPIEDVLDGRRDIAALGQWLIDMRGDLLLLEAIDFYEDPGRPQRPAARHERCLERLRRKVEQSVRAIDLLYPDRDISLHEPREYARWPQALRSLRAAATPEARKDCFREGISLLGRMLRLALESVAAGRGRAPAMAEPAPATAPPASPIGAQARPLTSPAMDCRAPVPAQAAHLRRQASQGLWLDLQGAQKKIAALHESTPEPADMQAVCDALLPHVDELSRNNRSLGLVFIRQLVLVADRLADDAAYDRAIFSAARSLEAMPIDRHASRFFDSPMSHVLALLHGLRRAAPEQAGLFLQTLDLCLTRGEQQRLPAQLAAEYQAMRDPPDAAFQREGPRFYLACALHCLAPHLPAEHAATLASALAEAFGQELPPRATESSGALAAFACRHVLASRHFYQRDVARAARVPAHAWLNLHDAGLLAVALLEAAFVAGRPLRVTVGGYGHQQGDAMPATRKAVLAWAAAQGCKVQERGRTDLWLFAQAGHQLPGQGLLLP